MRVLVLSHTRCGSTTLCKWLSRELNIELDETPYTEKTFDSMFNRDRIIRKIVAEEYFPTEKEINKFDKVIFLSRKNTIDAAISYINANNSDEWHEQYEVTKEWMEKNKIEIIRISDYISELKRKLKDYTGFHITYEDVYLRKDSIDMILDYMEIKSPEHLDMLNHDKKYRKDDNIFIKEYIGLI